MTLLGTDFRSRAGNEMGDERKVLVAMAVKRETPVSLTRIAEHWRMGTRITVSRETTTLMKTLS